MSCTKLQLPPGPLNRGLPPPDRRSLSPLSSTEFVDPPPNKTPGYATVNTVMFCCSNWRLGRYLRNMGWMGSVFIWQGYMNRGLGQLSWYSYSLRAGRPGDRIPVGGEIFRTSLDRPWGPPSFLHIGYPVFPGGKAAGAWR